MEEFKVKFLQKVTKTEMPPEALKKGCWFWTGSIRKDGYGTLNSMEAYRHCSSDSAHRISYIIHKNQIPDKLHILHSCDNRCCVNPDHLSLGDQAKNNKERDERGRQKTRHGADSNLAKLTLDQVTELRRLALTGKTYVELAAQFEIHQKTAREICIGKTWELPNLEPEFARQKKELDDRIITMYRSGKYSMRKLAEEVGRSIAYISGILPRE